MQQESRIIVTVKFVEVEIESDRVGYASLRFGNSSEALRMWSVFERL